MFVLLGHFSSSPLPNTCVLGHINILFGLLYILKERDCLNRKVSIVTLQNMLNITEFYLDTRERRCRITELHAYIKYLCSLVFLVQ